MQAPFSTPLTSYVSIDSLIPWNNQILRSYKRSNNLFLLFLCLCKCCHSAWKSHPKQYSCSQHLETLRATHSPKKLRVSSCSLCKLDSKALNWRSWSPNLSQSTYCLEHNYTGRSVILYSLPREANNSGLVWGPEWDIIT